MGEVLLRGPWVAAEYYRDERTADGFKDGWYHTGDVAMVDENGYLELVDRNERRGQERRRMDLIRRLGE